MPRPMLPAPTKPTVGRCECRLRSCHRALRDRSRVRAASMLLGCLFVCSCKLQRGVSDGTPHDETEVAGVALRGDVLQMMRSFLYIIQPPPRRVVATRPYSSLL